MTLLQLAKSSVRTRTLVSLCSSRHVGSASSESVAGVLMQFKIFGVPRGRGRSDLDRFVLEWVRKTSVIDDRRMTCVERETRGRMRSIHERVRETNGNQMPAGEQVQRAHALASVYKGGAWTEEASSQPDALTRRSRRA